MSHAQESYESYVEHPRYGRRPRITGLNPRNDYLRVFLHWHSGDDCRIPNTAITADLSHQSPATVPVTHYFDVRRTCRDCGQPFIFFALEQRHWYEELGFGLDADCVRCPQCRKKQQGIARTRQRYEELFHVADRSSEQDLEMAECCLTLMEESLFHPRQAERVRMLLKRTADGHQQDADFLDLVERLREFECRNGEPASGGNR